MSVENGTVVIDLGMERGEPETYSSPTVPTVSPWVPAAILTAIVLLFATASGAPARPALSEVFTLRIGPADAYAMTDDGQLLAQTFGTLSSFDLDSGLMTWQAGQSPPAYRLRLGDGLVLMRPWRVSGADPGTTAVSVATGMPKWERPGTVVTVEGSSALLAVNSLRGSGRRVQGPAVEAVDPGSGGTRWSVPVASTAVLMGVPGPSDAGGRMLLVHDDRTMALHDLDTGERLATTSVPAADYDPVNPAVAGGQVLLRHPSDSGGMVSAYDGGTLKHAWTIPAEGAFKIKQCGVLACLIGSRGVRAVHPQTGDQVWFRSDWRDIELRGSMYVALGGEDDTDPVAVADPDTGATQVDLTGWRPVAGQGGGDHLLLTRAQLDGARTMVAVARPGEPRPRLLADLPEGTGDCQGAPGRLVCRSMQGELVVWAYRLKG